MQPTVEADVDNAGSEDEYEHGEEDRDDVSVYEDEDEKAAVAEERNMELLGLKRRDDENNDDDCVEVEVHEEACGEEAVVGEEPVETAHTGDKRKNRSSQSGQKKKVKRDVVRGIQDFEHVELGSVISKEEQNKYPVEPERQADVIGFVEDWQHTVTVRYELATGIKTWPLPRDCPFSPAAKDTLCRLGLQRAIAMSLSYLTLRQQEILGRGRRRPFDLEDAIELPALDPIHQFEHIIYLDLVEDAIEGNGIYVGKATGKHGGEGRWVTYETAKRLGHAPTNEARSAHYKAFLRENAILHLRPLMIFPRGVSSTLAEIMEGLMMDFLETIDRSNLNNVVVGKFKTILMHDATMLERSKEAFPLKRQSTSCKGLNKVSSLKQATFGLLTSGCYAASHKCSSNKRGFTVYCENDSFQICKKCRISYTCVRRRYICVGTDHEIFAAFVATRKSSKTTYSQSKCFQPRPKKFECQYKGCNKLFREKYNRKTHEEICPNNPVNAVKLTAQLKCQYEGCDTPPFTRKSDMTAHEKICPKKPVLLTAQFKCQYEGCDKPPFTRKCDMTAHEKICPKNPVLLTAQFKCQYEGCNRPFAEKSSMVIHEKACPKNPVPLTAQFECQYEGCNKPFTKKGNLTNHEKICPKNPVNAVKLTAPVQPKATVQPTAPGQSTGKFKCPHEGCDKPFTRKSHMTRHEKLCPNNPVQLGAQFKCQYEGCNMPFTAKSSQTRHEATCSKNPGQSEKET
jgi:hypothetical protein